MLAERLLLPVLPRKVILSKSTSVLSAIPFLPVNRSSLILADVSINSKRDTVCNFEKTITLCSHRVILFFIDILFFITVKPNIFGYDIFK